MCDFGLIEQVTEESQRCCALLASLLNRAPSFILDGTDLSPEDRNTNRTSILRTLQMHRWAVSGGYRCDGRWEARMENFPSRFFGTQLLFCLLLGLGSRGVSIAISHKVRTHPSHGARKALVPVPYLVLTWALSLSLSLPRLPPAAGWRFKRSACVGYHGRCVPINMKEVNSGACACSRPYVPVFNTNHIISQKSFPIALLLRWAPILPQNCQARDAAYAVAAKVHAC